MYWNYFYHVWKTVSSSPFSNAVVFVDDGATITLPASVDFYVTDINTTPNAIIYTLTLDDSTAALKPQNVVFVQDATATADGIAVHKYGAIIMPVGTGAETAYTAKATINGIGYTATSDILTEADTSGQTTVPATVVGDKITLAKDA